MEHALGHHRQVGTPLDAVSASKGMKFEKFFFISAFKTKINRLRHISKIYHFYHKNYLVHYSVNYYALNQINFFGLLGT